MAKSVKQKSTLIEMKHRAVCEDDNWKGSWRLDKGQVVDDIKAHRAEPGNKNHVVRIVTKEIRSQVFEG